MGVLILLEFIWDSEDDFMMIFLNEIFIGEEDIGLYLDALGGLEVSNELISFFFIDIEGQLVNIGALQILLLSLFAYHCFVDVLLTEDYLF